MHKRDYLVKQFEEFGKVMAILLGLKRDDDFSDFEKMINEAVKKYTNTELDFVETINDETLIKTLTDEKKLSDEQLKILADLLYEKGEFYLNTNNSSSATNCYKKALTTYLFLKNNATLTYSLDMHYKIEILHKMEL